MSKSGASLIALATTEDGKAPSWVRLLPKGVAKPGDKREAWHVNDPEAIALASRAHLPGLVDIDHALDLKPRGSEVPAAGWIEEIAGKGPNGEDGVWGRIAWTTRAAADIADKVYRYISPVFFFDDATRAVGVVVRASLTNNPALPQKALASRERNDQPETSMFKAIAAALALTDTAGEAEILAAIAERAKTSTALATRLTAIGAAAGLTGEIGDDQVVALATRLKSPATAKDGFVPIADFDKLQKDLASLQSSISGDKATVAVEAAIKAGKLVPAQKDWAIGYASRDPEGFATMIGKQPVIVEGGRTAPEKAAPGELTASQKALCAMQGISEDDFKASAKALGMTEAA